MDVELQALRDKNTMIEINRCDVPKGKQIDKSTWAFKSKRRPNGEIYKLKARFVVRGDLQRLDDTDSTFSPVVDWSKVRLLFVPTVSQHLRSTTIDFNAAFVQSTLPEPISSNYLLNTPFQMKTRCTRLASPYTAKCGQHTFGTSILAQNSFPNLVSQRAQSIPAFTFATISLSCFTSTMASS